MDGPWALPLEEGEHGRGVKLLQKCTGPGVLLSVLHVYMCRCLFLSVYFFERT